MSTAHTLTRPATSGGVPLQRNTGVAGLVRLQVATEFRSALRSSEFLVGTVAIPIVLFAMIGLPNASGTLPAGGSVGAFLMVSWAAYGVVSLAIFTFGEDVAKDRARGWTRTRAATPLPTWVPMVGRLAVAVVQAVVIVAVIGGLAAGVGGVELPASAWIGAGVTLVLGVVACSPLGFTIAHLARPRAAAVLANLVFLPLSFCSGFFVPLSELPPFLRDVASVLPTYHLGQLAWQQVLDPADVEAMVGMPAASTAVHLAWVLGATVLFAGAALLAARRQAVTRRG